MIEQHEVEIRVRYAETDAMGFLHHSVYATYFELGRTELFRAQGGNYREIEEQGHYFVIVRLNCNYHAPARYDDLLLLRTKIVKISPAKLEHEYEIYLDDERLTTACSVLACVDRQGKVRRIPEILSDRGKPSPESESRE